MKIKNKPLFILFLVLSVIASVATVYLSCVNGTIIVGLFLLAVFMPIPMLWQTNANDYKGRTKLGRRIAAEGGGIMIFLLAHGLLLFVLWAICSFFVSADDGQVALFVVGVLMVMVAFSVLITKLVDSKATKYATLSSAELFNKAESGGKVAAGGISVIMTNFILAILLLLATLLTGLLSDGLNVISREIYDTLENSNILYVGVYNMVAMFVGLFIFCFGWAKKGTVARAINLYVKDRELAEWEKIFVQHQSNMEEWAQAVRTEQIVGEVVPGPIGGAIKAKGTIDTAPIMKEISSKGNSKWYILASIIGTIIAGLIIVYRM